jgi:hypothetical protein
MTALQFIQSKLLLSLIKLVISTTIIKLYLRKLGFWHSDCKTKQVVKLRDVNTTFPILQKHFDDEGRKYNEN